jgi:hypothetical protein
VPAGERVRVLLEVYDSKEFRGNVNASAEKTPQRIYKISQKSRNPLHSLGVLHRKKRWGERNEGWVPRQRTHHLLRETKEPRSRKTIPR